MSFQSTCPQICLAKGVRGALIHIEAQRAISRQFIPLFQVYRVRWRNLAIF
jgi:hypothetical protein